MSRPERKLMWSELGIRNEHRLTSALAACNKHRLASSVPAGPRVAHGDDAATTGASTATPEGTRNDVTPLKAETAPTATATTMSPTSQQAYGLGDAEAPGETDRDPVGEPRSDAVADIAALLASSRGEESRSGTRPGWLGEPDMMRAPRHDSNLLPVAGPTSRRDPHLAPDPGLDLFVADLFEPACPPGDLPPHLDSDLVTCALTPAVTPVDDAYLPPACVVCVMLGAGFHVVPIRTNLGNEQMKPHPMKQKSHLAHSPK